MMQITKIINENRYFITKLQEMKSITREKSEQSIQPP